MRAVLVVAILGIGLFSAGMSGVGRVDQQVASADVAAAKAARQAKARAVDCPWHQRTGSRADRDV